MDEDQEDPYEKLCAELSNITQATVQIVALYEEFAQKVNAAMMSLTYSWDDSWSILHQLLVEYVAFDEPTKKQVDEKLAVLRGERKRNGRTW